jgi:endogenous inhibitor of DNA gyrase (YacG/DUF329 family)
VRVFQRDGQNRLPIARCPACGKDMVVTRISPAGPAFERRTLRCVTCGKETIWMARIAFAGADEPMSSEFKQYSR